MADWKDILNDTGRVLSDDELLEYINACTSTNDKQQIKDIATDNFENDALEGLQKLNNPARASTHVAELKKQLKQQLRSKNKRLKRNKITDQQWIILATILLLAICILGYAVIKMF